MKRTNRTTYTMYSDEILIVQLKIQPTATTQRASFALLRASRGAQPINDRCWRRRGNVSSKFMTPQHWRWLKWEGDIGKPKRLRGEPRPAEASQWRHVGAEEIRRLRGREFCVSWCVESAVRASCRTSRIPKCRTRTSSSISLSAIQVIKHTDGTVATPGDLRHGWYSFLSMFFAFCVVVCDEDLLFSSSRVRWY